MWRKTTWLLAATCVLAFPLHPAFACEGDNVIFEDHFSDDSGGWALPDSVEVKDGAFVFKLPPDDLQTDFNVTFTVKDVDICSSAVWPMEGGSTLGEGLLFWGVDNKTYFQFGILNSGKFWIARRQDGKWSVIVQNVTSDAIKTSPGAENVLRIKTSGEQAIFFINGTEVRALRGQPPQDGWRFGLSGDNFDKTKDARVTFKSVKVTD